MQKLEEPEFLYSVAAEYQVGHVLRQDVVNATQQKTVMQETQKENVQIETQIVTPLKESQIENFLNETRQGPLPKDQLMKTIRNLLERFSLE
ncbi:hypothetical protein BN59_02268 [Legionella massiliensis]|uniref:Uncharacterized protein n=1 Tax=Legionella massiliensis TaxID=1034943 RepID=A0A078KY66_9GAMM|nr:hypothetical protein [Legionella massiliensis]CDZ77972.1 hypothetical protein BN59_02268 [Legionella massiliensis]CEE13710.1 hypothetical protein BN1094_02268 [Legionella massiliensis]